MSTSRSGNTLLGTPRWRFTFLQHGVTQNDLSRWINDKPIDLVLTATPDEQDGFVVGRDSLRPHLARLRPHRLHASRPSAPPRRRDRESAIVAGDADVATGSARRARARQPASVACRLLDVRVRAGLAGGARVRAAERPVRRGGLGAHVRPAPEPAGLPGYQSASGARARAPVRPDRRAAHPRRRGAVADRLLVAGVRGRLPAPTGRLPPVRPGAVLRRESRRPARDVEL